MEIRVRFTRTRIINGKGRGVGLYDEYYTATLHSHWLYGNSNLEADGNTEAHAVNNLLDQIRQLQCELKNFLDNPVVIRSISG